MATMAIGGGETPGGNRRPEAVFGPARPAAAELPVASVQQDGAAGATPRLRRQATEPPQQEAAVALPIDVAELHADGSGRTSARQSPTLSRPPSARLPSLPPRSRAPRSTPLLRQTSQLTPPERPGRPRRATAPSLWRPLAPTSAILRPGKVFDVFLAKQLARHPMVYRFGRLMGSEQMWLRSRTIFLGTYGRISMGRLQGDANATKVAIKETHERAKPTRNRTLPLSTMSAAEEAQRTSYLREVIEDHVPTYEAALWPNSPGPLEAVRQGTQKSIVFDDFEDDRGRHYLITTLELGAAYGLLKHVGAGLRPAIVASYVSQIALEMAPMHEQGGFAHLDINLYNISYNGFGQFKIMDFGLAQDISSRGNAVRSIPYGITAAPEMIPATDDALEAAEAFTAKVDVFCLAASGWQLLAGSEVQNPFEWAYLAGTDLPDLATMRRRMDSLAAFERALPRDAAGRVALPAPPPAREGSAEAARGPYDLRLLPPIDDPIVRAFLHRGIRHAPSIATILLSALSADLASRASPLDIARRMASLLPKQNTDLQATLRQFWSEREEQGVYHDVYRDADAYDQLLAEAIQPG